MRNNAIRSAYQRIEPTQADKDRMLRNILAAAPQVRKSPGDRPRYQKVYEPPKRSAILGPIAAALVFAVLGGGLLGWLSANRTSDPAFTQPPESQTSEATETRPTQTELALYAQALLDHEDLSSEITSALQGQPESTSSHHVYTFYDWNLDGKTELLVGLWNGNYAYRGSNVSVTHQFRLEDGQAVVSSFTGNEHMAYLCEGGVMEDVSPQGYQFLPVGEGTPVLRLFYDDDLDSWYKMSDDPNSPYDIPIEEAEKDQLLERYPHLKLSWQNIVDFPGLRELAESGSSFQFSDLHDREFLYSSGAGSWYATLTVDQNGTFRGRMEDNDNIAGPDYPNGTHYWCDFTGQFSQPVKVNGYTYSVRVESLQYQVPVGTEEIKNGQKYIASEARGLAVGEECYVYLPGAPVSELPEAFTSWTGLSYAPPEDGLLPFYGLYNTVQEAGFSSSVRQDFQVPLCDVHRELEALETQYQQVKDQVDHDASRSIEERTELAGQLYRLWDDALNELWATLRDRLDGQAMEALLEAQRAWLRDRDARVQEETANFAGGDIFDMVVNEKNAELTRVRVYTLVADYLCDQCPIPAPEGDSSDDGQAASPYDQELSGLEEVWADLNEQLQQDGSLTQADMNELSSHLHTLWDKELNRILEDLKADLEGDALTALTEEQQRWANAKDAEVQAAMAPYAGGTISGMIGGSKAAELTRDRVYELVDRYFR